MSILTYILGWPLLAALLLVFVPRNYRVIIRAIAVLATLISAVLAVKMFCQYAGAPVDADGYRFVQQIPWVESLGISYHVGVDGLNVGLILMGAIVAFAAALCSWEIQTREKEFYILLLVMTGGILGAFASLDLFFFYFLHELALVPTFIMIGVWGRGEKKNYATFQITLYLSIGALIALIGLIALYLKSGANTFDIPKLTEYIASHPLASNAQNFIFPLLLFGFGILVSLWPFHSWAPLGYGVAPAPTAMLHAGVLKKFGLYGLIRIALPLMPQAAQSWMHVLAWLCLGNVLYVGWVAMRQRDLNLLIGNSSVAHMGFIFLGIASLNLIGVTGAVLIMIAHGFLAALTFALSGYIYQKTGTLQISELGGLCRPLKFIGTALVMVAMAGCGLPGFANFVGEVTVFFGAWTKFPLVTTLAVWGALIIGAVYMTRAIRNILHGPVPEKFSNLADASNVWRKFPYAILLASLLIFGCFPKLLTNQIIPDAQKIISFQSPNVAQNKTENLKLETVFNPKSEIRNPKLMNSSLITLELCVIALGIVLLLADFWMSAERKKFLAYFGATALGVLLLISFSGDGICSNFGTAFNGSFIEDGLALFFKRFFLASAILVLFLSAEFSEKFSATASEFYSLVVFALSGMLFAASSNNFAMLFVSIELITVTFYVLVSFQRAKLSSLEAGVKYLIIGALSSAFMVFGIALIWGTTGKMNFTELAAVAPQFLDNKIFLIGVLFLLAGLGFKIAAVPFQIWAPDVYQGAPTPTTAFLAVGSKAAGFVLLLRVLFTAIPSVAAHWQNFLIVISAITILYGNLCAIPQRNLKRLLGYSSIAHAGYLLLGVAALSASGQAAIMYYFAGYLFTVVASFTVIVLVMQNLESEDISALAGLNQRSPLLASTMTLAMISLAGIPPLAGFFGKFLLLKAVIQQGPQNHGYYWLAFIALAGVIISLYYYFGVVRAIFWSKDTPDLSPIFLSSPIKFSLAICIAGMLWLGIFPNTVLNLAEQAASVLK